MKLRPEQLEHHLRQAQKKGLAPVYLVSGDVPLLVQEAADSIRRTAREAGCVERIVLDVDQRFNWHSLLQESSELSLFASQRLIELRLPSAKPGDAGSKALQAYVERASMADSGADVLLIIAGKIEKQSQKTKWFKALDKVGVIMQFWPLKGPELQGWVDQRLQTRGLRGASEVVNLLAERSEGNLLACAQEIDKLQLLYADDSAAQLTITAVMAAVADSARYDVFALVDAALLGNAARVSRILVGLRGEGTEPVVILWAFARELRMLIELATVMAGGGSLSVEMTRLRIWNNRQSMVSSALQRLHLQALRAMLARAARLDRVIKGRTTGNVWDELLQLTLMLAGVRPLKMVS